LVFSLEVTMFVFAPLSEQEASIRCEDRQW